MGQAYSCTSQGALLIGAAGNGDTQTARAILAKHPSTATFHTFVDRISPLLVAAGRGHYRLVQLILETAVAHDGPEKAKKNCINHTSLRGQSALLLACMNGHSQCVEYLINNGANPLICDETRQNTCLHWAASFCRSECVIKLLGGRATVQIRNGEVVPIADIPCPDDDPSGFSRFVDKHNGWGWTALHIAVFKGSISTVRALLRTRASLTARTTVGRVNGSPMLCCRGSTVMHIAAQAGDISMVRLLLEAQAQLSGGLDLRHISNDNGERPGDLIGSSRNLLLLHLLDERLPLSSFTASAARSGLFERTLPAPHHVLGMLLRRVKLLLSLEYIALQQLEASAVPAAKASPGIIAESDTKDATARATDQDPVVPARQPGQPSTGAGTGCSPSLGSNVGAPAGGCHSGQAKAPAGLASKTAACWRGLEPSGVHPKLCEVQWLLKAAGETLDTLKTIYDEELDPELLENVYNFGFDSAMWARLLSSRARMELISSGFSGTNSPADLVLGSLVTGRTVCAMVHAAKTLLACSSLRWRNSDGEMANGGSATRRDEDADYAYALMLLKAALRAVHSCLVAGRNLLSPPGQPHLSLVGMVPVQPPVPIYSSSLPDDQSGVSDPLAHLSQPHALTPLPAGLQLTLPQRGDFPLVSPNLGVVPGSGLHQGQDRPLSSRSRTHGDGRALSRGRGAGAGQARRALSHRQHRHPLPLPLAAGNRGPARALSLPGTQRSSRSQAHSDLWLAPRLALLASGTIHQHHRHGQHHRHPVLPPPSRGRQRGRDSQRHGAAGADPGLADLTLDAAAVPPGLTLSRRTRHRHRRASSGSSEFEFVPHPEDERRDSHVLGEARATSSSPPPSEHTLQRLRPLQDWSAGMMEAAAPAAALDSPSSGGGADSAEQPDSPLMFSLPGSPLSSDTPRVAAAAASVEALSTGTEVPAGPSEERPSSPVSSRFSPLFVYSRHTDVFEGGALELDSGSDSDTLDSDGSAVEGEGGVSGGVHGSAPLPSSASAADDPLSGAVITEHDNLRCFANVASTSVMRSVGGSVGCNNGLGALGQRHGAIGDQGASSMVAEDVEVEAAGVGKAAGSQAAGGNAVTIDDEDPDVCAICMDRAACARISSCAHGMCLQCAFLLCAKGRAAPNCPFCRQPIDGFAKALSLPAAPWPAAGPSAARLAT